MWTCVIKRFCKQERISTSLSIRQLFFKSNLLNTEEILDISKKVSDITIFELRTQIGQEEVFKNFFLTLVNKVTMMKTEDLASLTTKLLKNPDFRDYKHTFNLWPTVCKTILARIDSLSLEHTVDFIHSICFFRVSQTHFNELAKLLSKRLEIFNTNDILKLPINKFNHIM